MSKQHSTVIGILRDTRLKISGILTDSDDQLHVLRITTALKREEDRLALLTGASDVSANELEKHGPAKTLLGEKIDTIKEAISKEDLTPKKTEVEILKDKVEEAYSLFPSKTNDEILSSMDEMVVRGVAKKAGLKVTKNNPETITSEFIDTIKEAISKSKD